MNKGAIAGILVAAGVIGSSLYFGFRKPKVDEGFYEPPPPPEDPDDGTPLPDPEPPEEEFFPGGRLFGISWIKGDVPGWTYTTKYARWYSDDKFWHIWYHPLNKSYQLSAGKIISDLETIGVYSRFERAAEIAGQRKAAGAGGEGETFVTGVTWRVTGPNCSGSGRRRRCVLYHYSLPGEHYRIRSLGSVATPTASAYVEDWAWNRVHTTLGERRPDEFSGNLDNAKKYVYQKYRERGLG